MSHGGLEFSPFYERPANKFPGYLIGKLVVAALLGLAFLVPHYLTIGADMVTDWSWFLAPLIAAAMLALYYATDTLRGLLPEMSLRLRPNGHDGPDDPRRHAKDHLFMDPLRRTLSDRNFLIAGVVIGLINGGMGKLFGLLYTSACAQATILFGFFLAGFVCGMAAWGIYGVTVTVAAFSRHAKGSFDYTAPDHCGGVQFIGEGLVVFSSVTLVVGVMISIFIHEFEWKYADRDYVVALQWAWIVLPYVLSLVVLMGPAVPLNDALRHYKLEREDEQVRALAALDAQLAAKNLEADKRKALREEYAYQQTIRKDLHAMGTWPHGMSANLKYLGIFAANLLASASTVFSLLGKLK